MVDNSNKTNVVKLKQKKNEAKFTSTFIKGFQPRSGRTYAENIPYLIIRSQGSNSKYYTYKKNAKISNSPIQVPIGDIHSITLEEAKKVHSQNLALIAQNINPNRIDLGKQEKETTIIEHVERRLNRLKKSGNMSGGALVLNEGLLNNHIPKLGKNTTFGSLTDNQLEDWYTSLSQSVARQCISLLSATFNVLKPSEKKDNENPRDVIKRLEITYQQKTKKDVRMNFGGKRGDIGRFFEALSLSQEGYVPDTLPNGEDLVVLPPLTESRTHTDLLLFYLLTSVRKENVLVLKWKDIDWDTEEINFLVPKGQGASAEPIPQVLKLTPYLRAILESRKDNGSHYVFPSVGNKKKPFNGRTIDAFCTKLALFSCLYGNWNEKEDNPVLKIAEKNNIYLLLSDALWKLCIKANKDVNSELHKALNRMGTKPHGLRRTLGNMANRIGVSERTLSDILSRNLSDVDSKHYIDTPIEAQGNALHLTHKALDNRIAEYLSLPITKKNGAKYFESPILALYGIKSLIEVDDMFEDCGHGFSSSDDKPRPYQYGDIDL